MGTTVESRGHIRTPREEDRAFERAVLQQLLAIHPNPVTLAELVDEIAGKGCDFAQRDAIERAVHSLAGCGLLHRSEALVLPSRAALRFDELLGE
jgi:type IV secretory pathway protease TraF